MIDELDTVVLAVDLPEYHLKQGDIGTVVLVHKNNAGYEVEFVSLTGKTIAVLSLLPAQIRLVREFEIPHVRLVA
jgi:hypothetical protein